MSPEKKRQDIFAHVTAPVSPILHCLLNDIFHGRVILLSEWQMININFPQTFSGSEQPEWVRINSVCIIASRQTMNISYVLH